MVEVIPFDPALEFEEVVLAINESYHPGGIGSGPARNALLWSWALVAGRERAQRELSEAIKRHGSRAALLRVLRMSRDTLFSFETYVASLTERYALPTTRAGLWSAFEHLSDDSQVEFAQVAAELLGEPALLARLASLPERKSTKVLESALRVAELNQAVLELCALLDSGAAEERLYQAWCDDHSWVFGGSHQVRDAARQIDAHNIVDLLLPDVVGYRDIVELKRPDAEVLRYDRSHKTYYFSAAVSKAVGQVHQYMDRLHEVAKEGLAKHPHVVAYHPHATVVIGRSSGWPRQKTESLRGLNERLHGIDVTTYDHLLARAKTILASVANE